MLSRRSFIKNALFASAATASTTAAFKDSTNDLQCKQINLELPDLPPSFDGFKIAFITDPHLGECSSVALLERAVELTAEQKPDLLILGGDYVNALDLGISRFFYHQRYASDLKSCSGRVPDFQQVIQRGKTDFLAAASTVSKLKPPFGIIAVLGNHDRWNSVENCQTIFAEHNIDLLINQKRFIDKGSDKIEIYGSDDYSTGVPLVPEKTPHFRIFVSHNPDFLEEIGSSTNFSIGLSGHTHGGQVSLPVFGTIFSNIQYPQLIQGLNRTSAGSLVYTSAGIGTSGLPIRLNCPPELSILNLNRA